MVAPAWASTRVGMTLVEVLVSAAVLAILMGGMASAVALASKAVPKTGANVSMSQSQTAISRALDQLENDLLCAKTITELTANAITMTVPDRGHGASGDEVIRWAWSGVSRTALTRQYNGGTPETMADVVTAFTLTSTIGAGTLTQAPKVMLVVGSTTLMSTGDSARVAQLASWTFPTTIVDATATAAVYAAAAVNCDVVWYSGDITTTAIYGKLPNPSIGVVLERHTLYSESGISALMGQYTGANFDLTSTAHEVTQVFTTGTFKVYSGGASPTLNYATGTLSPDLVVLGTRTGNATLPALSTIEAGGRAWNSGSVRSRRLALPWGGTSALPILFGSFSDDSKYLLKRSLVWAAAPSVYKSVGVTLTAGKASAETRTMSLLNMPGVSKP